MNLRRGSRRLVACCALVALASACAGPASRRRFQEEELAVAPPPPGGARVVSPRPPAPDVRAPTEEPPTLQLERTRLPNGIEIVLAPRDGSPVTSVGVMLLGGSALDGERPGESLLSHSLHFGQGSGTEREDLSQNLKNSGADFDLEVEPDHVRFTIVGVDTQLVQMVALLAAATTEGSVEESELETRKNAMVDELWEVNRNPLKSAIAQLPDLTFGAKHPYGRAPLGTRRSLGAIDLAKVRAHLGKTLCPNRTVIVASGPVRLPALERAVLAKFGSWAKCRPASDPDVGGVVRDRQEVRIVHDPERKQVVVFASVPVFGLQPADAPTLIAAGELLGGSLTARLPVLLRAAGGYTYGVQAAADLHRGAGAVYVQTALDAERVRPALVALLKGIDELATVPPTEDELLRVERRLMTERTVALRSVEATTEMIMRSIAAGLPLEEPTFPTREQLVRFAAERLRPARVQFVLVGNAMDLTEVVTDEMLGTPTVVR